MANQVSARVSNALSSNLASLPPNCSSHLIACLLESTGLYNLFLPTLPSPSLSLQSYSVLKAYQSSGFISSAAENMRQARGNQGLVSWAQTMAIVSFEEVVLSWPLDLETGRRDGTRCCRSPSKMGLFEYPTVVLYLCFLSARTSVCPFSSSLPLFRSLAFESTKVSKQLYRPDQKRPIDFAIF